MSDIQLHPIKDQNRFESLVLDLFNAKNDGKMYQLYGRDPATNQEGIDIISDDSEIVIQCKKKDITHRKQADIIKQIKEDLQTSVIKAEELYKRTHFKKFILASTYKESKSIRDYCDELKHKGGYPFVISYFSWDSIEDRIEQNDNILQKYYPSESRRKNSTHKFFNVPFFDDDKLILREDVLSSLDSALQQKRILVVHGIGGLGKTTLVNQFAHDSQINKRYHHILWVSVNENLVNDFITQLSIDKLDLHFEAGKNRRQNFHSYLNKLQSFQGKNLLIIDNANDLGELKKIRNQLLRIQWDIIITSRTKPEGYKIFTIEQMSKEQALRLFKMYYVHDDTEEVALDVLIDKIDHNPLLVELLAKTATDHPKLGIAALNTLLDQKGFNTEEFNLIVNTDHALQLDDGDQKVSSYVYSVFHASSLDTIDRNILMFFAVIPSTLIDPDELHSMFMLKRGLFKNLKQHVLSSSFVGLNYQTILNIFHSLTTAPKLVYFLWKLKSLEVFINKLKYLSEIGWLRKEAGLFSVHPTIQLVIWSKYQPDSKTCALLVKYFIDVLKTDLSESPLEKQKYILAIESFVGHVKGADVEYSTLLNELSHILDELGESEKALTYLFQSLNIIQKVFAEASDMSEHVATAFNNIGKFYMGKGEPRKSIEYSLKAKEIREKHPFANLRLIKSNLADTYLNLTNAYREAKDYNNGLNYGKKSLELNQDLHGKDSIQVAQSYHNLSFVQKAQKNYDAYLDSIFKSNAIFEKKLASDHPNLVISRTAVANAYYYLKDYTNAKHFIEQAMELREEVIQVSSERYEDTVHTKKLIDAALKKKGT